MKNILIYCKKILKRSNNSLNQNMVNSLLLYNQQNSQ